MDDDADRFVGQAFELLFDRAREAGDRSRASDPAASPRTRRSRTAGRWPSTRRSGSCGWRGRPGTASSTWPSSIRDPRTSPPWPEWEEAGFVPFVHGVRYRLDEVESFRQSVDALAGGGRMRGLSGYGPDHRSNGVRVTIDRADRKEVDALLAALPGDALVIEIRKGRWVAAAST
jgi:hypothetical protein